nr:adhesin [Mycoplasmoides genitalium]
MPKVVVEYHKLSKKVVKESLEVEASFHFNPTQRLKKDSPVKDSTKTGEKLETTASSMSSGGATSTRKALKVEVEKQSGSTDSLLKNDFAKKPLKHKENSGEVKLDASGEFAKDKAWKPVLTTDEIKKNRGMGATVVSFSPESAMVKLFPTPPPLQLLLLLLLLLLLPPSPLFLTSMLGLNQWSLNT